MYYENADFFDLFMGINKKIENTDKERFYSAHEGFIRGNMFKELFDHYDEEKIIDYKPDNEKEALLLKIYETDFAINDLNLFLDLNPNDLEARILFNKYVEEFKNCKEKYEEFFGPLSLVDTSSTNYNWYKTWPWEVGESNV